MFVVPQSDAVAPENRFEFEIAGRAFSVPKMEYLTGRQAAALAGVDTETVDFADVAAIWGLFDDPADTSVGEAVRGLDLTQVRALVEAWVAASAVSPGESAASPA